jgi:hypothetical protein
LKVVTDAIDKQQYRPSAPEETPFSAHELLTENSQMVRTKSWTSFALVIPNVEYGTGFFVDTGDSNRCVVAADTHQIHALPSVTLHDGKSFWASVIHQNEKTEMTYMELNGVPDPEITCKGVKLSEQADDFKAQRDVHLTGYPGSSDGQQRTLTGISLPIGLRDAAFSTGFFSSPVNLSVAAFKIEGGGPGISGSPIFDSTTGAAIAVVAGGRSNIVLAKPISWVRDDIAEIRRQQP